jgi:hypothetical protein
MLSKISDTIRKVKDRRKACEQLGVHDLSSQIEHLKTRYPKHELIEDIESGLNFKRKGFNALLDGILSGNVEEVVVTHRDCCEAYTSKTCSFCGKIHNIGSKKILKYSCGITVDRDLNGARGILLRALAVTPRQKKSAIVNFS